MSLIDSRLPVWNAAGADEDGAASSRMIVVLFPSFPNAAAPTSAIPPPSKADATSPTARLGRRV
jgi:hypothetical protein